MDTSKLLPHQKIKENIDIPYKNINELFILQKGKNKNKIFLISPGIEDEIYTYENFYKEYNKISKYLYNLGLRKGQRINIIIPNSAEFLTLYFGALSIGLTVVPINQDITPGEMLYIIQDSQSVAIFYDKIIEFKIKEIESKFTKNTLIKLFPDKPEINFINNNTKCLPETNVNIFDEAIIIYTSGTTGNPKGVVLTHLNLLADAKAIYDWFHFSGKTRTLCILPLFHNNGQVVTLLAPLYAGGSTVIVKGKASLMAFWGLVYKYEVTFTSVMASILSILLNIPVAREDSSLEGIICGGQVLTRNVQNTFEKQFNVPVYEGFGLTETTSFACFNDFPANKRKIGSIGKPLPVNEMCIIDDNGNELKEFEEGEICIKGYNVASYYLNLSDKNNESFKNGWFHSGDFGYKDKEGYYYFKGRKDYLIIKGGENIYPAEIENVLYLNPFVAEAAVIGIPDKLLGQDIIAFIKVKEANKVTEDELKLFCKDKIAKFKQPKRIYIVDNIEDLLEIPKGPTKKVLYNKLLEFYLNNLNINK